MKKILQTALYLFLAFYSNAQDLVSSRNDKGHYVLHTVAAKESFYSLGRLYNIPPKDIAAFNGLEMERGLTIGQPVYIPLTTANFSQETQKGTPVYYVVGEREGLYRVSVNNNKVLMANLRKWNDLKSDAITTGQKLVVGYLTAPELNAVAKKNNVPEKRDYAKMPVEATADTETAIVREEKPAEKPVEKKEPPVEKKTEPVRTAAPTALNNSGYFKTAFEAQLKGQPARKDEPATAGIFKTASGWQDAKYYALIDGVEPGTIIRVINPTNNKAIYAKVLDKMTGIRQNQGYTVRISNAAAHALEVTETDKFIVRVNY